MEETFVRFSRPLLLQDDRGAFQIVYGFVVKEKLDKDVLSNIYDYCGYLSAMHEVFNGSDLFTISYDIAGLPFWKDNEGVIHSKVDEWMRSIYNRCRKKLGLTYTMTTLDIDFDYSDYVDETKLITSEEIFRVLEKHQGVKRG